jgi:autotransporter-associated beta strand protein
MLNLLGGTIDNTGGGISYGYNAGTGLGTGIVSLNGGNLFLNRFINKKQSGTTNTGAAFLNFNGATVTLTASTLTSPSVSFSSDFLPEMTAVYVNGAFGSYAGGVVIDTAGQNGIVDAALLAPTGQGVGTVALVNGGSGYVGAPFVTISGDGIGATAIANMVDDGTGNGTLSVASITVCNPGVNYTFASCSLSGPTPTAAASTSDVTLVANTSGGLTKNGAGALTLKGTNTYTGTTLVNAGALVVNGSLDDGSTVHVAGGSLGGNGVVNGLVNVDGALAPNGVLTVNNTLNLASASTTLMNVNAASNTSDMVQGVVQLNYGGTLVISNAAGTLIPGQTFSLFNGAAFTGNFAAIESVPGGVTWNFNPTNGVATVLSVVATTPASIHFTSSAGTLSLAWPSSNLGWYAQSNSVNVADTNFWFDIPNSQLGTNLDISINPAMPNVFYRLRSP